MKEMVEMEVLRTVAGAIKIDKLIKKCNEFLRCNA